MYIKYGGYTFWVGVLLQINMYPVSCFNFNVGTNVDFFLNDMRFAYKKNIWFRELSFYKRRHIKDDKMENWPKAEQNKV